jgi:hypothetical protein
MKKNSTNKRSMKKRLIAKCLVLVSALSCAPLLVATSMVPVSVETLTSNADLIVQGKAVRSWSRWNPQHSLIYTYTEFNVDRTMKGDASASIAAAKPGAAGTIVVKQLGGSVGGVTQHVSGVRYWQSGEEAVLFLRASEAKDNTQVIVGLTQGAFRLERLSSGEVRVSNGAPEVQFFNAGGGPSVAQPKAMTLQDLEIRIHKASQ